MKKLSIPIILIFLYSNAFCQSFDGENISQEELITIPLDTSLPGSMKMLEEMAQKFEGRKIVNTSSFFGPIGIPITQLYWKNALRLIVNYNGLILEELPGVYLVNDFIKEVKVEEEKKLEAITPSTEQIRISSIFFTADRSVLNKLGINWSAIHTGQVEILSDFVGADLLTTEIFSTAITTTLGSGKTMVDINSLLKAIESKRRGTIIARPSVTVISGKKGYLQIGKDFSIRTRDFAGNLVDRFFSTGIILDVTPKIVQDSLRKAIHLFATVERSDAVPGEISVVVNKNISTTDVILFDGEETVIAGLYDTQEISEIKGIPILKDLPWWFFGLRYLFGYNSYEQTEKEIIVILKAEIVEPIERRIEESISTKEEIEKMRDENKRIKDIFNEKKEKDIKSSAAEEVRPKGKVRKSKQAFSSDQEIYEHAKELYKSKRYAEAKEEFKKVLEKNADHKYADKYIVLCDKKMGKEVKNKQQD